MLAEAGPRRLVPCQRWPPPYISSKPKSRIDAALLDVTGWRDDLADVGSAAGAGHDGSCSQPATTTMRYPGLRPPAALGEAGGPAGPRPRPRTYAGDANPDRP